MELNMTRPLVVGIGGALSSLDAIQNLLRALGQDENVAIVMVLHSEEDIEATWVDALREATKYDVTKVSHPVQPRARTIYVASSSSLLQLENGQLACHVGEGSQAQSPPIDRFFLSLANDQGSQAIGVLLSGTGSDGVLGLRAILESGGMTFTQKTGSAPNEEPLGSAGMAAAADQVLTPDEIGVELANYAAYFRRSDQRMPDDEESKEILQSIPAITKKLMAVTNHDFKHYKTSTLLRRIRRRMQVLQIASVSQYLERLNSDADEPQALFRELLIGVTAFFRDPEAFESLSRNVLTKLFQDRKPEDTVRIWVPGCATG